jgi:hypothetical protein
MFNLIQKTYGEHRDFDVDLLNSKGVKQIAKNYFQPICEDGFFIKLLYMQK